MYKLGGQVENIERSLKYIGKYGRKAIGGTVRELAWSAHVVPHFIHGRRAMNMSRYTNAELTDIHFICGLANVNGRIAVRLYGERYQTRRQINYQTFTRMHLNLVEHLSFRARIDDMPFNSEIGQVT
ncbi:uncharacterized protein TNCV_3033491 [Trichonephila clavipes]|nr:uncharacterized protein TNCV_3033491 [Trichonephila clavipes]